MSERIYLGAILGVDEKYYRGVFGVAPSEVVETKDLPVLAFPNTFIGDNDYLYVSIQSIVYKYEKEQLLLIATSQNFTNTINFIEEKGDYLYIGSSGYSDLDPGIIYKLNKSDLSVVGQVSKGMTFYHSSLIGDELVVSGNSPYYVAKIDINTMTITGEASVGSLSYSTGLLADDTTIYYAYDNKGLRTIDKATMTLNAGTGYTTRIVHLDLGDSIVTSYQRMMRILNKSDINNAVASYSFGSTTSDGITSIRMDDEHFYISGTRGGKFVVDKIRKSDFSVVNTTQNPAISTTNYTPGASGAFHFDDNYIYTVGVEIVSSTVNKNYIVKNSDFYKLLGYGREKK